MYRKLAVSQVDSAMYSFPCKPICIQPTCLQEDILVSGICNPVIHWIKEKILAMYRGFSGAQKLIQDYICSFKPTGVQDETVALCICFLKFAGYMKQIQQFTNVL